MAFADLIVLPMPTRPDTSMPWCRKVALAVLMLLLGVQAQAAHILGGDITYTCLGGNNYLVSLDLFVDCGTAGAAAPQVLNFNSACGNQTVTIQPPAPVEVSQICPSQLPNSTCNGGAIQGVYLYTYQTTVNLPPCAGGWNINWVTCCRALTLNLVGAPGTYLEAILRNDLAPCTNSPQFSQNSAPYICVGEEFNFNFGVTAASGQSLVYTLIGARGFGTSSAPITYAAGFSGTMPVPGTVLDPYSGQLSFTPTNTGKYGFVILVEQYDANGVLIGSVMRDIMLIAMPCSGSPPNVQGPAVLSGPTNGVLYIGINTIEVCDGFHFCFNLTFNDADAGDVLNITSQAATLMPGSTVTTTGTNPMTVTVCWTGDVGNSPVNLLMQVNDGACPIMNTSTVGVTITSVIPLTNLPDAGTNTSVQVCPTASPFNLIDQLGGTPNTTGFWVAPDQSFHGPQFDPATDPPGVYTYTVGNACSNASSTVTVAITNSNPDAGTSGALTVCGSAAPVPLTNGLGGTPDAGGTWTIQATGVPVGPNYNPATQAPDVFLYTVLGVGGCPSATATVTVTEQAPANAGTNSTLAFCTNGAASSLFAALGGTPAAGGTWSGPSPVAGGMYNPATMTPGAYVYTVNGTAPCGNATATVTVTEQAPANAGTNGALSLCANGAAGSLLTALGGTPDAGGAWSGPSPVVGGMYDPATMTPG
ncbi:MAG TPA: hypothetical protein PLV70_04855, partial [Flavobacteriales bacterium]|nr:hypothetical protein [Flavobacteriales bacterium]